LTDVSRLIQDVDWDDMDMDMDDDVDMSTTTTSTTVKKSNLFNKEETDQKISWTSISKEIASHSLESMQIYGTPNETTDQKLVLEEDGTLRMYWFDVQERDGIIYLFGKVSMMLFIKIFY
jgi:hypothetical protein